VADLEAGRVTTASIETEGSNRLRLTVRTFGEILITLGILLLLFVVYQLFWTNVVADRAANAHVHQLLKEWSGSPTMEFNEPLAKGEPFALMYIPRLGANWKKPIIEGVTLDDLSQGVGHYPQTALPGRIGNFAVAGHRATNGQPFAYLDQVRKGDDVVVETATTWYTYQVTSTELVEPTKVDVILPVPGKPNATPHRRLMTLTTCNPRWASYQRLIVYGHLVAHQLKAAGPPAALEGN
jgi:sortase A